MVLDAKDLSSTSQCEIIERHHLPERLYLSGRCIDDDRLGAIIENARDIQGITIHSASITDAGIGRIAALPQCSALWIQDCPISNNVLGCFINKKMITSLSFFQCDISDSAFCKISEFVNLKSLRLNRLPVVGLFFKSLTQMSLERLYLEYLRADETSLARHICQLPQLRSLSLMGTPVTIVTIAEMRSLTNLEALFLSETGVTDDAVSALPSCVSLEDVRLAGCPISDVCFRIFLSFPKLSFLDLRRTRVTERGVREFLSARPYAYVSFG